MSESLKLSSALASNSTPFGLDDSAEDHYCESLSKGAHFNSETSGCDNTSTAQNFSLTEYHSANFQDVSPDSAGYDNPRHVDLCPSFSTCGPNNHSEPHPHLLRVSTPSDNASVHQLPMGNVPSASLPANCLPFSSVAAPQTCTDVVHPVDTRQSECCDGRCHSRVYTATDAENGLAQNQQPMTSVLNTLEPHGRDNTSAISSTSGRAHDAHITDSFSVTDSVPGLFFARGTPQRGGGQDGSHNVHRAGLSPVPTTSTTAQQRVPPSLNGRVLPNTPSASSRAPSIRSRRVSADSIQLSPLDTVTTRYPHSVSSEEADSLPPLLSPSGSSASDRDRPSTPATFVSDHNSYASSQVTSESAPSSSDDRSRYIRPGTPIPTQLPDIEFLSVDGVLSNWDATSDISSHLSGGSGNGFWLVSDDGSLHQGQFEIQFPQEEEDVIGDPGRAKELLEGLEKVAFELVRRYEKIRGDGHDICAICRDLLLAPVQPVGKEDKAGHSAQADINSNLFAFSVLPFNDGNPSEEEDDSSIHAFPCAHLFHTTCLFPWLSIKTTCPSCRLDIDPHSLTLRVRGWSASRFPQFDLGGEPRYVNVDVLGRRIPWHRPSFLSLEEWLVKRENENPAETIRGNQDERHARLSEDEQAWEAGASFKSEIDESHNSNEQTAFDENCTLESEASGTTPTAVLSAIPLSISATSEAEQGHLGIGRTETDVLPHGSMIVRNRRTPRNMHVALVGHAPEEDMPFTRSSLEEEPVLSSPLGNTSF